jgi:hypothetical protein
VKQWGGNRSARATHVIDQELVIAHAFVDVEGRGRMAPDQIVMVLECLGKRKRPKAKHQMERIGVKICDIMCPTFLAVSACRVWEGGHHVIHAETAAA